MNLYFDNASTSFPKPPEVGEFIVRYLSQGGTYGRAAYPRVFDTSKMVEATRDIISQKMGTTLNSNIIFTYNSTYALNSIIQGFNYRHKNILISPLEHNAVGRPVEHMKSTRAISYQVMPHYSDGLVNLDDLKKIDFTKIDLVIVNHVSNVNGIIQPIKAIKRIIGETPLLLDSSQSLGKVPVLADEWGVDMVAFTGHKGLLGPTGIGGFFIRNPEQIKPLVYGGTGSNSDKLVMPDYCPDRFEAGTQNILGIYGLFGALSYQPSNLYTEVSFRMLIEKLQKLDDIKMLISNDLENQSDLFSFVPLGTTVSHFTNRLYEVHKVEVRSGLHCAPIAHQTLGTFPQGAIRISLSNYHTDSDLNHLFSCITDINARTRTNS